MSSRQEVAQSSPPPTEQLEDFPIWHVHAGTALYRVTRGDAGPWWFASSGDGRFDLRPPRGTCYLADDPVIAMLEAFNDLRPGPTINLWLTEKRVLWALTLPQHCDAADITVRAARRFGVTAELSVVTPYDVPHAWAHAFAAAGYGGIRYRARHDPAGGRSLALFGRAGERTRWRKGRPQSIDDATLDRFYAATGIVVARVPDSSDLGELLD